MSCLIKCLEYEAGLPEHRAVIVVAVLVVRWDGRNPGGGESRSLLSTKTCLLIQLAKTSYIKDSLPLLSLKLPQVVSLRL